MIKFTIYGKPKGKDRPRFTKSGHAYTPEKTKAYEELVEVEYIRQCGQKSLLSGALEVEITAYFKIPKNVSKAKKSRMLNGTDKPTKKPDADNIAKIILDALNGVAYKDDAQIVSLRVEKNYSEFDYVVVAISDAEKK